MLDDRRTSHLAMSTTVNARYRPEILNTGLDVRYVVGGQLGLWGNIENNSLDIIKKTT